VSDYLSKIGISTFRNLLPASTQAYEFLVKSAGTGILNAYGQKMYAQPKLGLGTDRTFLEDFAIGGGSSYILGMWRNPLNSLLGV
jgi:hypothetical protein